MLALLCLTVSSAWADWDGGTYTATSSETITGPINVSTATLTVVSGQTVTVNGTIVISGTLTVTGGGTLNVNGSNGGKGNNGSNGITGKNGGHGSWGYDGGAGGNAIEGNVICKGATINARGGNGGNGGNGGFGANGADNAYGDADAGGNGGWGGWGGNGGEAITGMVTIYSGNINAYGGNGGNGGKAGNGGNGGYSSYEGYDDGELGWISETGDGGNGGDGGSGGKGGNGGAAFAGTVILYGGTTYGLGGIAGEGGQGRDSENSEGGLAGGASMGYGGNDGSIGWPGESGSTGKAYANDVTFEASEYLCRGGNDNDEYNTITSVTETRFAIINAPDVIPMTANLKDGAYWTTFYTNTGKFIAPDGTQVFAVNLTGTSLTLTEIEDRIVASGEGVVLKQTTNGTEPTSTTILMTRTPETPSGDFSNNSLTGTIISTNNPGNAYVLGGKNGIGFYKLSSVGTIGANKAYLVYSGSAGAREFFGISNEETGINALNGSEHIINDSSVYNLAGQRVDKPSKGLYIVNGKKVIIK